MVREQPVAELRDRSDVDNLNLLRLRLCKYSPCHMFGRSDIYFQCLLREIVRSRGHHSADMQDIVRTRHSAQNVLVVCEIAPDNLH